MAGFHQFRKYVEEMLLEFSRHEISLSRDKEGQINVDALSLSVIPGRLRESVNFNNILLPSESENISEIWVINPDTTRYIEDILMTSISRYADEVKKTPEECLISLGNEVGNMFLRLPSTDIGVNETDQIDKLSSFPADGAKVKRADFIKKFVDMFTNDSGILILYTLSTIRLDAMEIVNNDPKHPH